jgi:hypothetical protein
MKRECKGEKKTGGPCGAAPLKPGTEIDGIKATGDYCRTHDPDLPADTRFGSPQQAREAATGVVRRFPRMRDVMERKLEEEADRIVDAQLEALNAERPIVVGDGPNATLELVPDYLTRLRAGDTLMSRALGKPAQEQVIHAEHQVLSVSFDGTDPDARAALAEVLRRRPASSADLAG